MHGCVATTVLALEPVMEKKREGGQRAFLRIPRPTVVGILLLLCSSMSGNLAPVRAVARLWGRSMPNSPSRRMETLYYEAICTFFTCHAMPYLAPDMSPSNHYG